MLDSLTPSNDTHQDTQQRVLDYYTEAGAMTHPGQHAALLDALPDGIPELCRIVQGLLIHPMEAHLYHERLSTTRKRDLDIRSVSRMLTRLLEIDDAPLTEARPPRFRLVGNCRDFATLFCAFLRHKGIPARARCGFGLYFFNNDHWVCEYWHAQEQRWVLVDAQLDEVQVHEYRLPFDPCDLPREQFLVAGEAWRQCRFEGVEWKRYGFRRWRGKDFIAASLMRDLASLNKSEVLPWDISDLAGGKSVQKLTKNELTRYDTFASLGVAAIHENAVFPQVRDVYARDTRLREVVEAMVAEEKLLEETHTSTTPSHDYPQPSTLSTSTRRRPRPTPARGTNTFDLDKLIVRGAAQHNLKHIDVSIPRYKFVVLTGVSGSGKSSLAFDTIYAEGQRRYVESLSPFVRHYLEKVEKPRVDFIAGLSPAVAIEQKTVSRNPRSNVGTITEIINYLRLLYSRVGIAHCLQCGTTIGPLSDTRVCSHCGSTFPELWSQHFSPNSPVGMCPDCNGLGTKLEVDPDLVIADPTLSIPDGAIRFYGNIRKKKNSSGWPLGQLQGIADHYGTDLELPWQDLPQVFRDVVLYGSGDEKIHITHSSEWEEGSWSSESTRVVKGLIYHINRLFRQTKSDMTRTGYQSYMSQQPCPACSGTRLSKEVRAVTLNGRIISKIGSMTIRDLSSWVDSLYDALDDEAFEIASEILKETTARLQFILDVGLHYLTLDRPAPTLSGGEGQRIRLASQLGCGLVGVLYVLDEPSIGLHPRDQRTLIDTLLQLRDAGNSVLVVEHDAETMRTADWIVDMGPGAGILGGSVVAQGTPETLMAHPTSLTGHYLSGALQVTSPNGRQRRKPKGRFSIFGASLHNLKHVDAHIPLGVLTCITGVSGSGKSSLINGTLYPALLQALHNSDERPGPHERIEGLEQLDKGIAITQDAIGRTPRSNPATYVGFFDEIRGILANTEEARGRGYKADRFSFNVSGGRCESCKGYGQKMIEMHFLADVWVTCKECGGTRFNSETLDIRYRGKNIADILNMDVQEALKLFRDQPKLLRILQTLHDVGLDYIKLGQSAPTFSGGEAQRIKLAKELSCIATGRTLYILDEPTTGLHFADIQRLLDVLHRLVDAGNTVLVIEHNLDVIKTADWLIDMGPEGGDGGGCIVAQGTPEDVMQVSTSYTGQFLRSYL
jgi:excinuclease ABC subunit A